MKKFYRGFSTRNYAKNGGSFELFNVALIEEDLLNEIFTLNGERVKMPTFGTRIPLMVHEPLDSESIEVLEEDVRTVISHDPRVQLQALDVVTDIDRHTVVIVAKVLYREFYVTQDLYIEVNNR